MKTPRDVTQDTDPAPEPEDARAPRPGPARRPVDGTAESLYTEERRFDPLDEKLGHTGELAKPQGQAEVENKITRRRDGNTKPQG